MVKRRNRDIAGFLKSVFYLLILLALDVVNVLMYVYIEPSGVFLANMIYIPLLALLAIYTATRYCNNIIEYVMIEDGEP